MIWTDFVQVYTNYKLLITHLWAIEGEAEWLVFLGNIYVLWITIYIGMEIVIILEIIPIFAVESTAKSDDKE